MLSSHRIPGPGLLLIIASLAAALIVVMRPGGATATTYTVSKTTDTADGACDADCSLREAVIAANASAGADVITLPAGTYGFTLGGWEDAGLGGDLDMTDDVTINGAGAATTIVDAGDLDRVLSVLSGTTNVSGVTLRNGTGNYGGGIYTAAFTTATLNLTNVTVSENYATGFAGGINNGGVMTLTNSLVISNVAPNQTGGILNNFGTMTVTNTTVSANTAGFGPGGIYNYNGGNLTIVNSTIYGNTGGSGGIDNGSGTVSITNSTITGNNARSHGGGIFAASTTSLTNVTVTDNTADSDQNGSGDGGGIWAPSYAPVDIKNTVISGNADGGGSSEPECFGPINSLGNNLIQTVSAGCSISGDTATNVTGVGANLGPLAGNGGPTLTHALLAGSPAIDWGSADCPPPATDQRGVARPQGNRCDIGAVESSFSGPTPPPTPTPSPTPTGSPTPTATATAEPSATATQTPTATAGGPTPTPTTGIPTPTHTPSPTASPGGPLQGDVDCNEKVDSVDSLKVLRYVAGLPVTQDEPCTDIGILAFAAHGGQHPQGDVDCGGDVSSVDALKILRYVASMAVAQSEPCTDIGAHE